MLVRTAAAAVFLFFLATLPAAATVRIVAAENVYGDLARQVGGSDVEVTSILSNPNQDPHLFEASPSTARALAGARIVLLNGAGYDPWMASLIAATGVKPSDVIDAGRLTGRHPGANPHLWYDPATMGAVARALTDRLATVDPASAAGYRARERSFLISLAALDRRIAAMKEKDQGRPIAATEPVFGLMAERVGLTMREERFQLAIMNDAEPSASDVATFERDLRARAVDALIYNSQASEPAVTRLIDLAKASGVPVIGVTETEPAGETYQVWMGGALDALDRALAARRP